jgi:hypothetical protein
VFQFIRKHQSDVMGALHGFDRLRFRGTLRWLATVRGLSCFLGGRRILLKDFTDYSKRLTAEIRQSVEALAEQTERPVIYLNSTAISKEDFARDVARKDKVTQGLICVLSCVEPCFSYQVRPNGDTKRLELRGGRLKCLHQYLYFIHSQLGFGHLRLQTWFPFNIHVCLNGREWMCRELDRQRISYLRRDNCVVAVNDFQRAQQILDAQVAVNWPSILDRLATWAFPLHRRLLNADDVMQYYWSADDTEWASDLLFRSPNRLAALYPQLVRHGIQTFSSGDVMRFLGRKTTLEGKPHGAFSGEVVTDVRSRPEGVRIKHRLNRNSIKMYDKQGTVLRVETTITHPRDIKVFRRAEGKQTGPKTWRRLRKGVSDLPRRAQVSQAANERYLETLAAVNESTPLKELANQVCHSVTWQGRSVRGLKPMETNDQSLLQVIIRGDFAINGFRNRDLRDLLHPSSADAVEQRRQAGRITRQIRILRAHRLIKKVTKTHRYLLTTRGRTTITAFLTALNTDIQKLNQLAA